MHHWFVSISTSTLTTKANWTSRHKKRRHHTLLIKKAIMQPLVHWRSYIIGIHVINHLNDRSSCPPSIETSAVLRQPLHDLRTIHECIMYLWPWLLSCVNHVKYTLSSHSASTIFSFSCISKCNTRLSKPKLLTDIFKLEMRSTRINTNHNVMSVINSQSIRLSLSSRWCRIWSSL